MNTKRLFNKLCSLSRTRVIYNNQVIKRNIIPHQRLFNSSSTWRFDKKCWQCQSTNKPSALFCENKVCSVIQAVPPELNFFHLLQVGAGENKYVMN